VRFELCFLLMNNLRLALGRERPITFCLDTKSNKKIKPAQSLPLPTMPTPGRVRWQALASFLTAALLRNAIALTY
jgi:hypothetical protein